MAKFIIFCADGTWNGPVDPNNQDADANEAARTNVFKLFASLLATSPADPALIEQERSLLDAGGQPAGVAKYLHGVGNSDNPIIKLLGGSMGAGLISRVVRGYTFISRNYEPGDKIILNGFSRGAYTARALGGLLATKGVMRLTDAQWADRETAYRLGAGVWCDYQADKQKTSNGGWFSHLVEKVVDLVEDVQALASKVPTNNLPLDDIHAIAVWDTVGAMGLPIIHDGAAVDVFGFADARLSPKVKYGIHAVSVDERRIPFTPSLWVDASNAPGLMEQVLFPGAHSDVGGGYNETGLSNGGLTWMMDRLAQIGVTFAIPAPTANPADSAHEPWLGTLYPTGPRSFAGLPGLGQHASIGKRQAAGPVKPDPTLPAVVYAPGNLPADLPVCTP